MERKMLLNEVGPPSVLHSVEMTLESLPAAHVRVRHLAIGVNIIDVQQRAGRLPMTLPGTPGMEAAGVVEAVGPGVNERLLGQRVVYVSPQPGCYATARNVPAAIVHEIPPSIDADVAASVFSRGLMAWHFTRPLHPVRSAEVVLIHSASGVVGGLLAQMSNAAGARVLGVVASEEGVSAARGSGCHDVLLQGQEDFASAVKAMSGGGVDVVYDSVGKATFEQSLDSLRPLGLMVAFGNSSGKISPVHLMDALGARGSLRFTWCMLRDYLTPTMMTVAVPGLFELLANGGIKVPIGRSFELARAAEAHQCIENGSARGATLLKP